MTAESSSLSLLGMLNQVGSKLKYYRLMIITRLLGMLNQVGSKQAL